MWLHIGLLAVCTWVLPFCMGLFPVHFMKEEHKSFGMVWLSGWMMMFGVFQLLAVPFIVCEASFTLVVQCYTIVIGVLAVFFLFMGRNSVAVCLKKLREARPERGQLALMGLVVLLIVICSDFPDKPAYGYDVPVHALLRRQRGAGCETCTVMCADFHGLAVRGERYSCDDHLSQLYQQSVFVSDV